MNKMTRIIFICTMVLLLVGLVGLKIQNSQLEESISRANDKNDDKDDKKVEL